MTRTQVVVGVDGGGTKTLCLVADLTGRVIGEGLSGPSNYMSVGRERAGENLAQAISQALEQAGCTTADVAAACLGLAGVGRPEDQVIVRGLLRFLDPAPIQLVSDGRIALAGAFDGKPGVIVIGGTGSSVFGINAADELIRAGGWGWILGDEGSGFFLGRSALSAALAARDGTGPATDLGRRICDAWEIERLDQAVLRVYGDVLKAKAELAALAPVVIAAAADGDQVAAKLLEQAGHDLAIQVAAVLKQVHQAVGGQNETPPAAAVVGGVLSQGSAVRDALQRRLEQLMPGARLVECQGTPVQGAVRMALDMVQAD